MISVNLKDYDPEIVAAYQKQFSRHQKFVGYKTAASTKAIQSMFTRKVPISGRLLASHQKISGSTLSLANNVLSVFIETEILVTLGKDLPKKSKAYTKKDISAAISLITPALEVANVTGLAPPISTTSFIIKNANNVAYVAGQSGQPYDPKELKGCQVSLYIDNKRIKTVNHIHENNIIEALTWLANHLIFLGCGLKKGQVILSGASIAQPLSTGEHYIKAIYSGLGSVDFYLCKRL